MPEPTHIEGVEAESMTKELVIWLICWPVYLLLLATRGRNTAEWFQAREAMRLWLHSKPNRERRLAVHQTTGRWLESE